VASNDSTKVQAVQEMVLGNRKPQPPTVDLQQAMRLDTASELKDKSLNLGPDIKLTALHMNQAQVRSLTLGGSVRGVRVGDKGVCQAFASGPNQLKLIGTGIGTTRLVVWAQTGGDKDEVLMRAFEIHVNEVVPTEGNSIESTTELLNQSIQKVFPNSQAKVQLVRGELWVTGSCESQDSAERIIRMVRKSCLIPVRDQLTVK
jgi:Flp pilus assembly secretin CpaC